MSHLSKVFGTALIGCVLTASAALGQFPNSQQQPPYPQSQPQQPQYQQPPNGNSLEGTEWNGSETLQGFGKLTFRFGPQGQVVMVDAQGTTPGVYAQRGQQVVLAFFNGDVIYEGMIAAGRMGGVAGNRNNVRWSWSVNLRGGSPAPGTGSMTGPNR